MRVIVVLGNDAANLSMENVIRLLSQKHEIRIMAPQKRITDQNTYMFSDLDVEIKPFGINLETDFAWADCVLANIITLVDIQDVHKYIFTICHNVPYEEMRGCDFVFTQCRPTNFANRPVHYAAMGVGISKNDHEIVREEKKQFLYIDAGHFPFGIRGRQQIAEMLLSICSRFPDYTLCVKPRWFPGANGFEMSHPNFGHLYDEIKSMTDGAIPSNLLLLDHPENMQDLIDESVCVISSCTGAYLDAVLRGKPVLLVNGIENEDMYHLRNKLFESRYEFAMDSGCVVNYKEAVDFLPQGIKCSEEHIKKAVSYTSGASERVVEVMEYVTENYLKKGKIPELRNYDFETYKEEMTEDKNIQWEDIFTNRRFCSTETALALTSKISFTYDFQPYFEKQMKCCRESMSRIVPNSKLKNKLLREEIEKLKCEFLAENPGFISNDVDASYHYHALYSIGNTSELEKEYEKEKYNSSLLYYMGLIWFERHNISKAAGFFQVWIEDTLGRNYPRYISDTWKNLEKAFVVVFQYLISVKNKPQLKKQLLLFEEFARRYPKKGYKVNSGMFKKIIKILGDDEAYSDVCILCQNYC